MPQPTLSIDDTLSLSAYLRDRDAPRLGLQNGVYPECTKVLAQYAALEAKLAEGGEHEEWGGTHTAATAAVAPYIAQLQTHMGAIITIMDAIAATDPRVFPALSAAQE